MTHVWVSMSGVIGAPAVHGPQGGIWHSSSRLHDAGESDFGERAGSSSHAISAAKPTSANAARIPSAYHNRAPMHPLPLTRPFARGVETALYTVRPRPSRSFHTALDASDLFTASEPATLTWSHESDEAVGLTLHMPVLGGHFDEKCTFDLTPSFRPSRFERVLTANDGRPIREERVDFASALPKLPDATYPETLLPFLLRGQPLDGKRRSLYAWICDRFVAKVYYEVAHKHVDIRVPAGRFDAHEVVMYPDLNDWVKLGSVLTRLAKPFLPKYHMWFAAQKGGLHRLVRFEGPYGPPGAPEIVLELMEQ